MTQSLMISVAGVRGIVGESLTPPVLIRFAAAFAQGLEPGPVVIGRDARPSGAMLQRVVAAGLLASGREVVDLGLATTPTTEIAVEHLRAAGGVILTASHNPPPWNALKFLSARGEFLDEAAGKALRERVEDARPQWVGHDRLGVERSEAGALDWHIERVLGLDCIEPQRIRDRKLRVAVDGCASVGGVAVPRLLRELGATVVELDCVPNGAFTRELEPLPEHLGALGRAVADSRADFGIALDPDADRAAFVDHAGTPLGEEYTLALGAQVVLAKQAGPIVTNLSTSLIVDSVCARFGVPLFRSPVGEANVVAEMKARGAVAGGEGNGGMIVPAAHYGRDGLVAAALVAQAVAASGKTLRALADELPRYHMIKHKEARADEPWEALAARLRQRLPGHELDTTDGLRFRRDDEWLHVRVSGTEPVVRLIAESLTEKRTGALIETARKALAPPRRKGS
ncbi:MAG TPA: phosphoglucosamine mutase [Candidatus Eisenbacteria bacterium]|jgi:phosphomannomutase